MAQRQQALRVVVGHPGLDTEELADLTDDLRRELDESGLGVARRPAGDVGPSGAKGDALTWAELLLTFTGGLPALVALIRSWTSREEGRTVTLELGGEKVVVSGLSSQQQDQVVSDWLDRRTSESGEE